MPYRRLSNGVFESWSQMMLTIGLLLVLVVGLLVGGTQFAIIQTQHRNAVLGLKNRAELCRSQLGQGMELDDNCRDPAIKPYFDAHEQVATNTTRAGGVIVRLICTAFVGHLATPDCEGVPTSPTSVVPVAPHG